LSNLKDETLETLKDHGKTWADVRWIGHQDGNVQIHPDYFLEIADKEYDAGYGGQEVNASLVVVGDGWWLERHEYDGSEWYEFKTAPTLKQDNKFGKAVFIGTENYNDDWSIMSNLEYLEWENNRRETKA
jgi:hypothetical protein